jgi:hypothetical protein
MIVEREDFRFQVLPEHRYSRNWASDDLLIFLNELNNEWKPGDTRRYCRPTGTDPAYFRFTFRRCEYGRSILVHMLVSGSGIRVTAPRHWIDQTWENERSWATFVPLLMVGFQESWLDHIEVEYSDRLQGWSSQNGNRRER